MDSPEDMDEGLFGYNKALSVTLGYRDMMTHLHSERVRDLTLMIAEASGADDRQLAVLRMAAIFHDVGKIGISDQILLKPSRLDEAEWEEVKRHSEIGEQIMLHSGIDGYPVADVARTIRHHHEYYDGAGYPDGLAGEEIPLFSRIIAIADSYDAMSVTRAYHAARTHDEIMEIMRGETGNKFDPALMDIFCARIVYSPMRVA
jgi:HD-GYP domain-containing protein (c-di-GMP phosphodiesterase class II)